VFKTLQAESTQFTVARPYIGGSFGKKTDVIECDLDLHVVLNDFDPAEHLDEVLESFKQILARKKKILQIDEKISKHSRSLSFCFKNGIEVDLLPESNITDYDEVISLLIKYPKDLSHLYNPSFVDKQIYFMSKQDSGFDTHSLIRVAKYWYKTLYLGESFKGGSVMIETLCVASAREEVGFEKDKRSMLRAFTRVIDMITKLDSLKMALVPNKWKKDKKTGKRRPTTWKRVPEQDFSSHWNIVPDIVGTKEILERKAFVIDPTNPFQDFLEPNSTSVIQRVMEFAEITRTRLSQLVEKARIDPAHDFIATFLEPQPANLKGESSLKLPIDYLMHFAVPCRSPFCDIKILNNGILHDPKVAMSLQVLKMNLLWVVNGIAKTSASGALASTVEIGNAVKNLMQNSWQMQARDTVEYNHEAVDATLTIPYARDNGQNYAVRFSAKWN